MKVRNYQKPMNALRFFDDFFNGSVDDFFNGGVTSTDQPSVNVLEKDDEYVVELAAPGMKKDDFAVHMEKGMLRIKAESEEKNEEKEEGQYLRREFSYRSFERSFALPEDIASDDIKANYEGGVLTVHIPRKEVSVEKRKVIDIK